MNKEKKRRKRKESTKPVSDADDSLEGVLVIDKEKAKNHNPKLYFNAATQEAIIKFQNESTKKGRDKLYVEEILPAFDKLVENLINIYKFTGVYNTYEELKNDCVNFLFETLNKFDHSRGTNAFSYFNVVAKNWLISKTKQKIQKAKKSVSLDDPSVTLTNYEIEIIEEHSSFPSQDILLESTGSLEQTIGVLYEVRTKVKTENELTCINSVITIFENIEEIDLMNKSAILLYMRELSGLSPKQLATAIQAIKKYYKKLKIEELDI